MPAFKGASSKVHRTPRQRALDIGTAAAGFKGGLSYDPQGGHPIGPGMPAQEYEGNVMPAPPKQGPVRQDTPFKLGGK